MVISKEKIADLPIEIFEGRIEIIDSIDKVDAACDVLANETIIGFDTETKPSFKKGVSHKIALLQLATQEVCFLFRLNLIGMPDRIMEILNNPNIKIIGLSLKDDFAAIRKMTEFKPNSFVELQTFVQNYGIEDMSLQKVYAILFGKRITKSQRLSNWEAKELTEAQQMYAALDAWACLKIYEKLITTEPTEEDNDK